MTLEVLSIVTLGDAQIARVKALDKHIHLAVSSSKSVQDLPAEAWQKAEVLLASGTFLPTPEQAPNLKWVHCTYAGVEPMLKFPLVHEKRVTLTSSSGAMVSYMGEYALMALLMLGHRMPEQVALQKARQWAHGSSPVRAPVELRGSTVGIVGYGSIGREVARLLYPFGAHVLAAKRDATHPEDYGYTPEGLGDPQGNYFKRLYPLEGLKGMLAECDFVVLALPHTAETHEMFNADLISAMKPGVFLVNIGRGGLVDEAALLEGLKSGQVGGAVLDVFQQEPLPPESPFWGLPNVIVTPHVSGNSSHLLDDVIDLFVLNLKRYQQGESLYNVVNVSKGY